MKKIIPIIITTILLAVVYFIINNSGSDDRAFRSADESLQSEYNRLRLDYLQSGIDQQKYIVGIKNLAKKENDLFEEVRNHKFENIAESNYWHRGRLKFPSNIIMELDRIIEATKDSAKK
jgi:hypothetical protein